MKRNIIIVVFDICLFLLMFGSDLNIFEKISGFIGVAFFSIITSIVMWTKFFTNDIKKKPSSWSKILSLVILALINSCFPFVAFYLAHIISATV